MKQWGDVEVWLLGKNMAVVYDSDFRTILACKNFDSTVGYRNSSIYAFRTITYD